MTARLPGWRRRLAAYVEGCRRTPFAYGSHDCGLFIAGAVEAMTGVDHAAELRGRYTTFRGGMKAIWRAGYIDHLDLLRAHADEVTENGRPAPHLAQVGDIALIRTREGPALGLVQGSAILVVNETGVAAMPLMQDAANPPKPTAFAVYRV